ncbi:MAG: ATP-dependent Clp protease proteolytic subunit [Planctomycetes bacterium]|nr:ATP-dependent Clp protease proteolytic subunit [Planctomycetota bacterium]
MNREAQLRRHRRRRWPTVGLVSTASMLIVALALGQSSGQPASGPAADSAAGGAATAPATRQADSTADSQDQEDGYFAKLQPTQPRPMLPAEVTKAFIIPIHGMIDSAMVDAIKRKTVILESRGAELVIFDFDTPGGRVDSAFAISKLIKNELANIRTVAFVNSTAYSAGALLSLACHEIVMVPRGMIGDCAPIAMGGELKGIEREKIESPLRSEFRDSAEANGYWPGLAESMVSYDIEIWIVQNVKTSEKRYVKRNEWNMRVQNPPGQTESSTNPSAEWKFLRVIVPTGNLLTMTTREAVEYGFAQAVVQDMDALKKHYNITTDPTALGDTWSERLVSFLTSPAVTGLLLLLAMFFGYIEVNTPGFGAGGTITLICLAILFGSRYLTGLALWCEISLFVIGVILLAAELFITPGFGVLGALGALLCLAGILASLIGNAPNMPPLPRPGLIMDTFLRGLFALGLGFLGGCVLCIIVARFLPNVPIAGRLVLNTLPQVKPKPSTDNAVIQRIRSGDKGVVEAICRPAGKARFGDELVDVVAEGEFLNTGTPVVAWRNEGNRIVVRPDKHATA